MNVHPTALHGSRHQSIHKVCYMLAKPSPEESSSSSPFLMCSISDKSALEFIEALHQGVEASVEASRHFRGCLDASHT